jgi:virginiamycin B lyase
MRTLIRTIAATAALVTVLLLAASGGQAVGSPHVYWTNHGFGPLPPGTIGQANLDGTGVNQSFIADPSTPLGLAVDSNHIYWANVFDGTIGRANLDGTGVNQSFITGAVAPVAVAVDSGHVYWADQGTCATTICPDPPPPGDGTIGRANLDGTGVNLSFITGATRPDGVAVDGG